MEFYERVRQLRKETGETQVQAASAVGITERQYQGLEAGTSLPNYHTLGALADHFDVSVDYLMGRTDQR